MITVVGDTHGRGDARLCEEVLGAIRAADAVVHTGDFLTQSVLGTFRRESAQLYAVYGNNDSKEVQDQLPRITAFDAEGLRIVVVHGHEHTMTGIGMLARQERADLVVVGHSHNPQFVRSDRVPVLNPGSYAVPRQFRAAYATLAGTDAGTVGKLIDPDDGVFETFTIERRAE